jgi:hypothetical protein
VKKTNRLIATLLIILLEAAWFPTTAFAAPDGALDSAVNEAAAYMLKTVKSPEIGSVGGEWAIIGLARSEQPSVSAWFSNNIIPDDYYEIYYNAVEKNVLDNKGILHEKKYTEYSRVILGLTAAGYDPRNVGGYDLTLPLGDFERTIWQGINGPIWALIALDSGNYNIPVNREAKTQATRELYIAEILRRQLSDGGWNLTAGTEGTVDINETSNPDITGMALQALAKYQSKTVVKAAIDRALAYLSKIQDGKGGYAYGGDAANESVVQVLVALTALKISPEDPRFVKNGNSVVDNILSFKKTDGSFSHMTDGSGNSQMSTEQALYGLVAAQRTRDGKNSLYDMSDAPKRGAGKTTVSEEPGLPGKHADVQVLPLVAPGRTFSDISGHENKAAIEALTDRGIINGKTVALFDPDATMTRAEFAAIVTRGLGLPQYQLRPGAVDADTGFKDVSSSAWYAPYVGTAYYYGIVTGTGAATFEPEGTITRQEAAVMVARAAKLCGMDTGTGVSAAEGTAQDTAQDTARDNLIRDTLAQFGDYKSVSAWAEASLVFCYTQSILDDSGFYIEPVRAIKRCEIAEMLYRMLSKADLIV